MSRVASLRISLCRAPLGPLVTATDARLLSVYTTTQVVSTSPSSSMPTVTVSSRKPYSPPSSPPFILVTVATRSLSERMISISKSAAARSPDHPRAPRDSSLPLWWTSTTIAPVSRVISLQ